MILFWLIIVILVAFILIILGLLGLVIPIIPDLPLIWLGIAVYAIFTKFTVISWQLLLILFILAGVVFALDFWIGIAGAKVSGASRYGVMGAILGMLAGIFIGGIFGMFFGAFAGVFIGELIAGKNQKQAIRAGLGTIMGFMAGRFLKLVTAVIMVGIFLVKII